jgi:serine/threonine-protein kinase
MIGKILGKRYELVEKIGEGGMGLVYKAKCHLLNRYVAVKILKPELTEDEEFINRFRKESLSAASLSHPNIVNIYDVGVEDGIYYIVMEYVKGKTLKEIIKERAPMPYYETINISRQICLALEHAHNNNIIHRDIKPQNILITHDGIVKVADFGIARASNSATLTNTGNVIGSVYYISPEQARGGYTDQKTDIYSLGTVMFEMAASRVPFIAESPVVVALKHIQEGIPKPSEINPDIPVALEDIIIKALEKNPADRYESAAAMIKDLDRASANPDSRIIIKREGINDVTRVMPVIKGEYADGYKTPSLKKKHSNSRKWVIAGIIAALVLIAAGILFFLLSGVSSRNKDVAVPSILDLDEKTAEDMLKAYGLKMKVVARPYDEKPQGTVIKVWPDVGFPVKPGYEVHVKVSAGPEKVLVPDVKGQLLTDAIFMIEDKGLVKGSVIMINDELIEPDKVISQTPEANTQAEKGTAVDLYVSKGPEIRIAKVPILTGVTADKVEARLSEAKLKIGKITYANDPSKPDNTVLNQSIPASTQVPENTEVDVVINKIEPSKPEPTQTPSPTP